MKRYNTIYYLLFVLLMTGSFASMAQNNYGMVMMGLVGAGFSILFLTQLFSLLSKEVEDKRMVFIELGSLVVLAAILTLRIFLIHFNFIEIVFVVAGLLLVFFYTRKLLLSWNALKGDAQKLGMLTSLFYGSIIFYLLSMVTVPFWPFLAEPFGALAFLLIILFAGLGIKKNNLTDDGEKISAIEYVAKFKDRSVVLIFLFLLFTAYMGLTKIEVLPKMYSDEYPQAYFELVNRAESGKEEPENGKFKHQEFKEAYNRFVERSAESE